MRDPDLCDVSWCDETRGHDGPHTRYLGDLASVFTSAGTAALSVVSTGTTRNDRHIELVIHGQDTGLEILLTHSQQRRLSKMLTGKDATR